MWCLLLLFILLIMLLKPKPEGFGTYDYLSPIPIGIKWDQNTIQKFVDKYNTMGYEQLNASTFADDKKGQLFMKYALEEEGLYYVKHGYFPYDEYVKQSLEHTPIPPGVNVNKVPITNENVARFYPNRYVYMSFISQKEASIKPTPEAYQIFKGSAQAI